MNAIYAGMRNTGPSGFRIRAKKGAVRARRELVAGLAATVRAQRVPRRSRHSSASARCTSWTQIEPSPTADATRFTLVERASPTQKTPGMQVSIK